MIVTMAASSFSSLILAWTGFGHMFNQFLMVVAGKVAVAQSVFAIPAWMLPWMLFEQMSCHSSTVRITLMTKPTLKRFFGELLFLLVCILGFNVFVFTTSWRSAHSGCADYCWKTVSIENKIPWCPSSNGGHLPGRTSVVVLKNLLPDIFIVFGFCALNSTTEYVETSLFIEIILLNSPTK